MRPITLTLCALLAAIQYPLWFGHGGWFKVHEMRAQVAAEERSNAQLRARNEKLAAEVKDLKEGAGAVEERARFELGMIKEGEVFVQVVEPGRALPEEVPPPAKAPPAALPRP